jgi:hypothetical protein
MDGIEILCRRKRKLFYITNLGLHESKIFKSQLPPKNFAKFFAGVKENYFTLQI